MKLLALVLSLIYFSVLQNSTGSNDYTSKKEYCISEIQRCTSPNGDYGSGEFDDLSFFPICYTRSVHNSCVRTEAFMCMYEQRNRDVVVEDEVISQRHEYFRFAVPIIIFTVLAGVGTLLFQSKLLGISFVQQDDSSFSSSSTEFYVDKVISAFCAITFSLMIVSSQHFRLMVLEDCDANSNERFCNDLNLCGLDIRSIVFPTSWFAREYRVITVVLALLVLVCEVYSFVFPPEREDDSVVLTNGHRIRQMTIRGSSSSSLEDAGGGGGAMVYVIQTPGGSRVSRRYTTSALSAPPPLPSPLANQTIPRQICPPAPDLQSHEKE
jgi:hypothetical protein